MRRIIFAALVLFTFTLTAAAHTSLIPGNHLKQQNFRTENVAGNIHVLFGAGGNIGVSYGEDGLMTIDTQFARFVPQIKAELAKLGSDKPKYIFNTHYHGDHTGGNELFGVDALIFAHENVKTRLLNRTNRDGTPNPMSKAGLPFFTFKQSMSKYMNGEWVEAVHMPSGHTDGDTVIFFTGSNVVHLGDDFFAGRFPYVDLNAGGSVQGLTKNIATILKMIPRDAKLIPGHGPISSKRDLSSYHAMLLDTTRIVRGHMKAGKSYDEVKKAGLPEKYKSWVPEGAFISEERWIETIFKSFDVSMKAGN